MRLYRQKIPSNTRGGIALVISVENFTLYSYKLVDEAVGKRLVYMDFFIDRLGGSDLKAWEK